VFLRCEYLENCKFADKEIEQTIYWLHRAAAAAWCINLLRMVWRVPELTGANVHHGLGGKFGFLRRPYGVSSWSRKTKKSHFTTTTTPRRISYVGICKRVSTGAEKILSQFSFNDGTKRKALSWRGRTLLLLMPCKIHLAVKGRCRSPCQPRTVPAY
jgi:hypothetical protein